MKNIFLKNLVTLLFIFVITPPVNALEIETHKTINAYIAQNSLSGFSLGIYLKDQLGFTNMANEKFNSLEVWKLIRDGGEYEDIPLWYQMYLRSRNHFHNPRYTWDTAGLTDKFIGKSAILWALSPIGTQSPGGYYSWYDVRDYYYKALTFVDKNTRDTYFAQTFRGVGQFMHIVQDMSVPEHTRNDFHSFGDYEGWVLNHKEVVTTASSNPIPYTGTIKGIYSFFDTDQYNGSNPSVAVGNKIGLAEYTNANFLSPDTIFTEDLPFGHKHYQPYPRRDSVIDPVSGKQPPEEITAEDGKVDRVFYVKKVKDGEIVNHLAQASYLASDLYVKLWPFEIGLYYRLSFQLDDTVYKDYASFLLPRAVGYSAGLLNYFFRGQVDMEKGPNNSSQYVIKNESGLKV